MVWRACERFGITPPGFADKYDDLAPWMMAKLLGYEQVREYEESLTFCPMLGEK